MASSQEQHANSGRSGAPDVRRGSGMEESGAPQAKVLSSRIPARTWKTTAKPGGSDTLAEPTPSTPKSPGIRPPQVRTNPRVTRQGVRGKTNSDSSCESYFRYGSSPSEPGLDIGGLDMQEDPSPLSPSSTLTRRGAFRYGRGVKPLEVLNLGSGAATLPRMRPKGCRDIRNSDIFTNPDGFDHAPQKDVKNVQAMSNGDPTKREQTGTSKKNVLRPQSLGRMSGIRQQIQERALAAKGHQTDPTSTGPRISKGITRGGSSPPKGTDISKVPKRPGLQSVDHQSPKNSNVAGTKEQKQPKISVNSRITNHSRISPSKEATDAKHVSKTTNRSIKEEHEATEMSPKAPPRRQRTLPMPTSGLSSGQTTAQKCSKIAQEPSRNRDQLKTHDTPKPPPRRHKAPPLSPTSAIPKAAPTIIPRAQSLRHRRSRQLGPAQTLDSHRHSLPPSAIAHLSNKSSHSYPQATKGLDSSAAMKERQQRQRSQSTSHIPVYISQRSSLQVHHRPVNLRPKVSRTDKPNPIFRLSLEGADSGTEYSSSLATTPSECSIDIDAMLEDGSPVCQTTPAKFYSISGLGDQSQDQSASGSSDKLDCQQREVILSDEDLPIEVTHVSQPASDPARWSHIWPHEVNQTPVKTTDNVEIMPSDHNCDKEMPTTPKNETQCATSDIMLPKTSGPVEGQTSLDHDKATDYACIEPVNPSGVAARSDSVDHSSSSIRNRTGNFRTSSSEAENPETAEESCGDLGTNLSHHPAAEHSKANSFARSKMGREIALRVARGDLVASSVDAEGEARTGRRRNGEDLNHFPRLTEPHRALSARGDLIAAYSMDGLGEADPPDASSHQPESTIPTQEMTPSATTNSSEAAGGHWHPRSRRKVSTIQSPHKALQATKESGVSKEDQSSEDTLSSVSGSSELEKMMDTEYAIPTGPAFRKNSFPPENSETEEAYLRFCSDPLHVLEFLMNVDDPPKIWGERGECREAIGVRRRTKSDVVSPSERAHPDPEGEVKRWSMPSTLEQWSQHFWSHLMSNMRARQSSPAKDRNTEPDGTSTAGGVPVTSRMLNTNRKLNPTPREPDRIQGSPSTVSQTDETTTGNSANPGLTRSLRNKRWSIPLEAPSLLPSVDAALLTEPNEKSAKASAALAEKAEQPLKRKSWWRWSLPVPLRRSLHSSVHAKDPESGKPRKESKAVSQNSQFLPAFRETEGPCKPNGHLHKLGKRVPSFSDIADGKVSASTDLIKVFVDSSYVEQSSGLRCPGATVTPPQSPTDDKNAQRGSGDGGDPARDESTAPSLALGDRGSKSRGSAVKKRLSWKRERSLEAVRYVEGRDSAKEVSEDEAVSDEEEGDHEDEARSAHTPLGLLPKYPSKEGNERDAVAASYVLPDLSEESKKTCKPPHIPTLSPWILPSDELKSKLESVYAERQKGELHDDEKRSIWKLAPDAAQDADSGASPRDASATYHPDGTMRDAVAMSTGIGKRFSLKQQLSCDGESELSRLDRESMGRLSRDSIKEAVSGSMSPAGDGMYISNSIRPKLNRPRSSSGSGSESIKDTRRKLDDVSHKTRLRIERDREIKTSVSPSSPAPDEPSKTTPPRTRKPGHQGLTQPNDSQMNGEPAGALNKDAAALVGESMQAFRRRKKSMAIALSEGLLDIEAEHPSSLEKTSELQMVSHISQLNQELMRLTQQSPPGTPPTPVYHSEGTLQRSPSHGSLISLPGAIPKPSFPGMRMWNSVAQFQTNSDATAGSMPDDAETISLASETDKSSSGLRKSSLLRASLKDEEDSKEKMISPKVLLSRIQQWRKKKGQPKHKPRPEIIKLDPEEPPEVRAAKEDEEGSDSLTPEQASLVPLSDTTNLRRDIPGLPVPPGLQAILRPVPLIKDTALRKTWHGMPSRKTEEDEEVEDHLGRSNFQRCNSLRNPIRQRKRGLSPMENAHLVAMHLSTETIPGSSVDSGIVKDRPTEEMCLAGDSDTSSSNLCSPCSSLSSSNPPSRPLSSDIVDLQWERGSSADCSEVANGGTSAEERRLSAVSIGRRESGSGVSKVRRPVVTRLTLIPGLPSPMESPDAVTSPKKVTFSLMEDPMTKRAMQQGLRKLPKPLHAPRRVKTDPGDVKAITGAIKEFEKEAVPSQTRPNTRRRALTELSSIHEKNREGAAGRTRAVWEGQGKPTPTLARPRSIPHHMSLLEGQEREMTPRKNSLADLIDTEVGEVLTSFSSQYNFEAYSPDTMPTFAEALWDHVTMEESELAFKAGDVIEVTDMRDKNWWWGCAGEREGWVPAQFVRLRVSQGETVEECVERLKEEREQVGTSPMSKKSRKVSLSFLSNEQVRAKVVEEIITTERDYVRHLHDVCEGYISQAMDRPEMFSQEVMNNLFGNIEELYSFQKGFLLQLEATILQERPHLSSIGGCFLEHKNGFETYSEYCNNYPKALRELKQLREKQKYGQFFEACRLLQNMIQINLEGFLLTPVQKICKYPLQLRELLKYTRPQHADYRELQEALEVMKDVAVTINDRKRRIENIEKIAAWQKSIGDWEGEDLLDKSTQLVHSGDITQLAGKRWTAVRRLFLFDHQLVICKKDWKGALLHKKRIDLDVSEVVDMPDGRDLQWNVSVKNAFKIYDAQQNKLHIFSCKTEEEKQEWLKVFARERESVMKDREKGFSIPSAIREAAMKNVMGGEQPSKPQDPAVVKRKVSNMPYAYHHKILTTSSKKVPLPKGISSTDVFKKKGKGLFGIGKK